MAQRQPTSAAVVHPDDERALRFLHVCNSPANATTEKINLVRQLMVAHNLSLTQHTLSPEIQAYVDDF
jgi:hypothetical protein